MTGDLAGKSARWPSESAGRLWRRPLRAGGGGLQMGEISIRMGSICSQNSSSKVRKKTMLRQPATANNTRAAQGFCKWWESGALIPGFENLFWWKLHCRKPSSGWIQICWNFCDIFHRSRDIIDSFLIFLTVRMRFTTVRGWFCKKTTFTCSICCKMGS